MSIPLFHRLIAFPALRYNYCMNPVQQATAQVASQSGQQSPDDALQQQNQAVQQALQQKKQAEENALTPTQTSKSTAPISQALGVLNDKSIAGKVGKAIATPSYAGYCLKWVDDQQGNNTNRQPTAYADYLLHQNEGDIATKGTPPKNARVYFGPNATNGEMGHVGISNGNGTFTSATDNGIQTFDIKAWEKYAGQTYIGYSK